MKYKSFLNYNKSLFENFIWNNVINFIGSRSDEDLDNFREEINMMKLLGRHNHVISMLACCTMDVMQCIVLEFAVFGDLLKVLQASRKQVLPVFYIQYVK